MRETYLEDEIDLREIFLTLWHGKTLIIALSLGAAIVALVLSLWVVPKKYKAEAFLSVTAPIVWPNPSREALSIQLQIPGPDVKAIVELMKSDSFLKQVANDPRMAPLLTDNKNQLEKMLKVSAVANTLIRVEISASDPVDATTIANVLAESAAAKIEQTYGLGVIIPSLQAQIEQAQQAYDRAQKDLEAFLAENPSPILYARLQAQQEIVGCLEARLRAAETLKTRLEKMEKQLTASDEPMTLAESILLASLQQDIDLLETCGGSAPILQASSPLLFNGISAKHGRAIVAALKENLEQRIADTKQEQTALQGEILTLRIELERLAYRANEYTRQRQQARQLYEDLTEQKNILDGQLKETGRLATVSAVAEPPEQPDSPRPLQNTALAGALGLMLGVFLTFAIKWWKEQAQAPEE